MSPAEIAENAIRAAAGDEAEAVVLTERSGLARFAESEVHRSNAQWIKEIEQMMGPPIHGGGEAARWIREDRDHHDDKRMPEPRDEH